MIYTDKSRAYARIWQRAHRMANRAEYNAYMREWRAANPQKAAYATQKGGAKRRGIPFLLTFEQWWSIWEVAGKWEQRGKLKGQYVMARFGDAGPYAIDNVRICTFGENVREFHVGKFVSIETRKKFSEKAKAELRNRDSLGRYT